MNLEKLAEDITRFLKSYNLTASERHSVLKILIAIEQIQNRESDD